MQVFHPRADTIARFVFILLVTAPFLFIVVGFMIARSPYVTGQDVVREQPVPFSHQHHVGGLGIDCRYCHNSVEQARFAGIPPTETCMTCHSQIWTNAGMLAPVRTSLADDQPLRWRRVHNLPDYVYFDHAAHVANGVGCSTCHGPVDQMPLMRQAAPLTMGWCLDCHRDPAPNLRPRESVFDMSWMPPRNQAEQGQNLVTVYHIDTQHLTDCSTCHR
ncbi:cytochrome c3 family protein [Microvirga sp. TS319]|uniref:cytochrome c3 family protein n=1 Tax=Microvirga sp. TS319 TaxID=3241165 RepID=UPI003519F5F7